MDTIVSADQTPIAYTSAGGGLPLVLVHGTTADCSRWRTMLPLALVAQGRPEQVVEVFFRVEVMPGQQHVALDTAPELFATRVLDVLDGADR